LICQVVGFTEPHSTFGFTNKCPATSTYNILTRGSRVRTPFLSSGRIAQMVEQRTFLAGSSPAS
jgi:hypothetical protein